MSIKDETCIVPFQSAKNKVIQSLKNFVRDLNLSRIDSMQKKKSATLCVGAGISADINKALHDSTYLWNGLVYAIAGELLKGESTVLSSSKNAKYQNDIYQAIDELSKEQKFLETDNTLECVEYLKNCAFQCEKGTKEELYAENVLALITHELFNSKRRGIVDPVKEELSKELHESYNKKNEYIREYGHTLIELAKLIERMHKCTPLGENVEIITYNYDDYLETALSHLCPTLKVDSIYDNESQKAAITESIHIYHVHGYVPKTWDEISLNGEFVFSESSYGHMSNEIYHWTNRTQVDAFIQKQVLFVGFSGVDINFRRLMKEIKKEKERLAGGNEFVSTHKLFMSYSTVVKEVCSNKFLGKLMGESLTKMDEDDAVAVAVKIIETIIKAKDSYYKEQLGIELLWYNEKIEIPEMIHTFFTVK